MWTIYFFRMDFKDAVSILLSLDSALDFADEKGLKVS
jgi:hypothetical protein